MKIKVNNQEFSYISDDTNEIDENGAFVLTSQNSKYQDFAKDKGCRFFISVEDCFNILGIKDIKIVGITGTNGKTTTASIIYQTLMNLGYKAAMQGTRGSFMNGRQVVDKSLTTPSILHTLSSISKAIKEGCEYFVMEVSSHAISQNRIEGLSFALKLFTNISQDHLDFHKSMDEYIGVKSSFLSDDSLKIVSADDESVKYNHKNAYTFALVNSADFKALSYDLSDGISALCSFKGEDFAIKSSLQGEFNLYNLLLAYASIYLLTKKDFSQISSAVSSFGAVEGRMEVVSFEPLVIVDFAHTPDGVLKVLDSMKNRELVVVLGAGGDRDKSKRPIMGKIAKEYAKKLYITSDNPRSEDPQSIIEDILSGIEDTESVFVQSDRKKCIEEALGNLKRSEVLMILGKGDEDYQEIKGVKYHFSDKEIVLEYFKRR